ncbi:MAG: dihydrofolate reductase family protein [Verrucomicrobia subdivision 3 bacterium]|nr:dihydrofolate reductase family protein [Limisphaerales bacterium]
MRPHVSINMAMTADGKIASANREVTSFGSRADHAHLLALRDQADAILTGAGTLNAQPEIILGPGPKSKPKPPLRIIASGSGQVNTRHKIFRSKGAPVLVLTTEGISPKRLTHLKAAANAVEICGTEAISFKQALDWLSKKWGVKRLLCEGGGQLNDSLFRAGVVDEVNLTVCPRLFGGRDAPTIADGLGFAPLKNATQFTLKSRKQVGDELFLVLRKA